MRFMFTLAMLGLTLLSAVDAQRIGGLYFNVPYQVLPSKELPTDYTTYSTRVMDPYGTISRSGFTKLGLKNRLKMRNYRMLSSGGHLLITYQVDRLLLEDMVAHSSTSETKKKDGTVEKKTVYWMEGTYTFPITMELVDEGGGLIHESVVHAGAKPIRFPSDSKTYTSKTQLRRDWSEARAKMLMDLQKELIPRGFNSLNKSILNAIDVQEKKTNYYFEYPKGKKAENAELWLAHATSAKEIIDTISASAVLPKGYLTTALQPHLDFWKEQMNAYPHNDKKTQRYHHAAAYNLATVALVLENPGVAQDLSVKLYEDVKWNRAGTRLLSNAATTLSSELENYPGLTRYFPLRDVSTAAGPTNARYGMPEPIPLTYDTIVGYVTINGERKAGKVIMQENVAISLMGTPNLQFIDGEQQPIAIDVNKISGFGFGDFDFVVESWADKLDLKERRNFMRVLVDGPRMQYLEYYPTHKDAGGDGVEFLKPKGGSLISLSVTNVRWLIWKKAFAKVFASCPGLAQRITAGEFSRTIDDIADAVQQFNEGNCELPAENEADDGK